MSGLLFQVRDRLLAPDGSVLWEAPEWMGNEVADEGEKSILDVYLGESAHPTKYLALLNMASPSDTTTMATMTESVTPGTNGYSRQQVLNTDWGAAALDAGDYMRTASTKTFGPPTTTSYTVTHIAMVTVSTGTSGLFVSYIALSATRTIPVGVSYDVTFKFKAQ